MKTKYSRHMRELIKLSKKINRLAFKKDSKKRWAYWAVADILKEAVTKAEQTKLIRYKPETKEEWK